MKNENEIWKFINSIEKDRDAGREKEVKSILSWNIEGQEEFRNKTSENLEDWDEKMVG